MREITNPHDSFSRETLEKWLLRLLSANKLDENLIENGTYYFLARPRRFGKSLLVSTLQALFEGRKELFTGLAAHDRWDGDTKYPVIKLSFAGVARNVSDMHQDIANILQKNQERLGISCKRTNDIGGCFQELIEKSCRQYQD